MSSSLEVNWPSVVSATVAGLALLLSLFNLNLALRQRRDMLFDRRFKFYEKMKKAWLSTQDGQELDGPDLIPYAEEASFLFGKELVEFIMSLSGRRHGGSPFFPDSDFTTPFEKYLTLNGPIWQRVG